MSSDPKDILAEFGIDVNGKDPDGQYQWKMLSLKAGDPERKRLEKAWSAYVLGRKEVDLAKRPALADGVAERSKANAGMGPGRSRFKRSHLLIGFFLLALGAVLWILLHDTGDRGTQAPGTWLAKYEALRAMVDESAHDDEHHEEFILLAEAAREAILAGQGPMMLDRMNTDVAAERARKTAPAISTLADHKEQWKAIVEALVMNKVELLEHEEFKGHHEGEL